MNSPTVELPDDLDLRLQQRLATGHLPGRTAQQRFAPSLCYGRHFGVAANDARSAAVIMALYRRDGEWYLPLTLRPRHMNAHADQICLPGGALDLGESFEQAAVRELDEELGVPADQLRPLGALSSLFLFVSNFAVTPFVAVIEGRLALQPNPSEVATLIEAPVASVVNPANHGTHQQQVGLDPRTGWCFEAPHIDIGDHRIWGATAVILGELIALVDELRLATTAAGASPIRGRSA